MSIFYRMLTQTLTKRLPEREPFYVYALLRLVLESANAESVKRSAAAVAVEVIG